MGDVGGTGMGCFPARSCRFHVAGLCCWWAGCARAATHGSSSAPAVHEGSPWKQRHACLYPLLIGGFTSCAEVATSCCVLRPKPWARAHGAPWPAEPWRAACGATLHLLQVRALLDHEEVSQVVQYRKRKDHFIFTIGGWTGDRGGGRGAWA